jgi:2-aminomuconate deaminase
MNIINQEHNSNRAPSAVGLYPHARQVDRLLFLSGVGPRLKDQKEIPGVFLNEHGEILSYDIKIQTINVFNNVKMILEDCGSSFDNLIDVTVFLTNMKNDFAIYNNLYAEYFKNCRPTRTTVEVNALPTPIAIELKCIALMN